MKGYNIEEKEFFFQWITMYGMESLKTATDDYASRIWNVIEDDVVNDVLECTDGKDGFTKGDVALAIGRVIARKLEIEV